jgi:hypothetical protein
LDTYLRDRITELESVFGEYLVFEHGPGKGRTKGVCVDHAHLHLIPLSKTLRDDVLSAFAWRKIPALAALYNFGQSEYVFAKIGDECLMAEVSQLGSQWIRRRLAASIENERPWDWAVYTGVEELEATRLRLDENGLIDKWKYTSSNTLQHRL